MTVRILEGDCRDHLKVLADAGELFDGVVTDPPYHLTSIVKRFGKAGSAKAKVGKTGAYARASRGFMGKAWDGGDIAFQPKLWRLVYDVLKPGAHLIAFSGTRTYHRMASAIEDAGFEIRDQLAWMYGTGFPKSHNQDGEWENWGTALKPAWEPIVLARKPLDGTVAANLRKHGTGALNIGACRLAAPDGLSTGGGKNGASPLHMDRDVGTCRIERRSEEHALGRWPANVIHDGSAEVLEMFDLYGIRPGQQREASIDPACVRTSRVYGRLARNDAPMAPRGDEGSAARFFFSAKAQPDDHFGSRHPCVTPGELVLTSQGLRPIEDIAVGDHVLSDDGRYQPVIDRFASPCEAPVYRIGVRGTNLTTEATGNHPFLVWRPKITYGRARDTLSVGSAEWVLAEDLRVGDQLMTPVRQSPDIDNGETDEWWFAAGLWLAEGSVLTNGHGSSRFPTFSLSLDETDLIDRLKAQFGAVGEYPNGRGGVNAIVFTSGLVDRFIGLCGRGDRKKFIASAVLDAKPSHRRAFLEGFLAGDGCVVKGKHRAKTASRSLASLLPVLAESLGLRCSVYRYDDTNREIFIEGRKVKGGEHFAIYFDAKRDGEIYARPPGKAHRTSFVMHEGRAFSIRAIKSIASRDYQGPVWNLTVEKAHTFQTAIGMSHNTIKPVALIKWLADMIVRPGGRLLDPFAGTGPIVFARPDLDITLIEREPEYVADIKRRVEHMEGGGLLRDQEIARRKAQHPEPLPADGLFAWTPPAQKGDAA